MDGWMDGWIRTRRVRRILAHRVIVENASTTRARRVQDTSDRVSHVSITSNNLNIHVRTAINVARALNAFLYRRH